MPADEDPKRFPLSRDELLRALAAPGGLWSDLRLVERTGSTNADVRAAALAGAPEGLVVVAEEQSQGRGRLGREWQSPPRAGLTFSVLLRPADVPAAAWGWLPLVVGVALATALRRHAGVDALLKWPNDVLVAERKLAGVLVERVDDLDHVDGPAAVVGVGVNVLQRADELPVPTATSLALAGATSTDRAALLRAALHELAGRYGQWRVAAGDVERAGLRAEYRDLSASLGRPVRISLPDGGLLEGTAADVDSSGRLVLRDAGGGIAALSAGDVVHVRTPAAAGGA
ncbi:MAG: biotin--[acetyl-CoA-carboxylase] ligase [Actinomycetota bacterium]|nr:biotin--[acetyl-CoA-carboxylase] ligase [Actinomycetota bacterium]